MTTVTFPGPRLPLTLNPSPKRGEGLSPPSPSPPVPPSPHLPVLFLSPDRLDHVIDNYQLSIINYQLSIIPPSPRLLVPLPGAIKKNSAFLPSFLEHENFHTDYL
ncbi:MAG TPA: hypothetical protein IGS52_10135 [Oscillatoriaceae cyanobacterium M33_DOE_052]|uniref:Uncharacterized protein n=1 Tax=Planktothricoides sp. SpSt-374 TaxID=2282167 RepID=A0A7C3ZL90_9CYAN|nr:hypothetical protein [Oscillatoriaceae cyanobacterium M33_DOE_052]